MKKTLLTHLPFILIMALAAVLRINFLHIRGDFSFDEFYSYHFSILSWPETIEFWIIETNPPLYSLLIRGWINLFGSAEATVRSLSLVFGLGSIVLLYHLANKFFSRSVALISSLLLTLSATHIIFSTENRGYALLTFLSILSFYLFFSICSQERNRLPIWLAYTAAQTILLYTHLTAALLLIIQMLTLIIHKPDNKKTTKKLLITNIISSVLFAIWFLASFFYKFNGSTLNGWYFQSYNIGIKNILNALVELFVESNISAAVFSILSIILILLAVKAASLLKENSSIKYIAIFFWALLPFLLASFLGMYQSKYILYTLPGWCLLISLGITCLKKEIQLATVTILMAILMPLSITTATSETFSWSPYLQYIKENETKNSLTLSTPFCLEPLLKRYYHGDRPIIGIYPIDDNFSPEERIARFNWQTLVLDEKQNDEWMKKTIAGADKIFLIKSSFTIFNATPQWLIKNGWILQADPPGVNNKENGFYLFEFHSSDYEREHSTTSTKR